MRSVRFKDLLAGCAGEGITSSEAVSGYGVFPSERQLHSIPLDGDEDQGHEFPWLHL